MDKQNKNYTYFNKDVMVFKEDGEFHDVPSFVERARARYRFDHERKILQKSCSDCGEYFDVQLFENGFHDIHNEDEIHYMSEKSGYSVRCKQCLKVYDEHKKSVDNDFRDEEDSSGSTIRIEISDENNQFLSVISSLKQISKDELVDELLAKVRKHNNYKVTYDENL